MKLAKAPQEEIDRLMHWLQAREKSDDPPPSFMRVVFGYETLVANTCDPAITYLEFKPELLAAMEDKKRLDWLDTQRFTHCTADGDFLGYEITVTSSDEKWDIRRAIDAARVERK